MLPRLLPSSATDAESDSDSLASPLDAHSPIAHVNIARRSRLLESPIHDISRQSDPFDSPQGAYAPYISNPYSDISYDYGCSQGHYLPQSGAQHGLGEPQSLPALSSGLYGFAPCPDSTHNDGRQYSTTSDTALHHHSWGPVQDADFVADSPTSAVSDQFFPPHPAVHGFDAQYSSPGIDYDNGGCRSGQVDYSVACGSHGGSFPAPNEPDVLVCNYSAEQQDALSGTVLGGEYATFVQTRQGVPIARSAAGGQYLHDLHASPHSYPGRGDHIPLDRHFGGLAAAHAGQYLAHDHRERGLQYCSTLADSVRSEASLSPVSSHGHAMVSSIPRHDRYVYPTFDYSPSPSPSSQQHPPSIHAPQPKSMRPVPISMQQHHDYRGGDDVGPPSLPMQPPYQVLSIPTAPPPPPPAPLRHSAPVEDTPKKPLTLACFFCRKRKIACGSPPPGKKDRTCNQCARRNLKCVYPEASRRGMRPKLLYDRDTLTVPTIPAILS